ncbi:MAG: TIR domain-containing protein [Saprospiraceae bacterium]|nr:TIR domain-containing protein [Candidatus Opimibacter iunctus]
MSTQKIFFSYSRADSPFALTLAKDLREAGADIWIDQLDIPAGSHWDAAVEKALNSSAYVLVILTTSSTQSTNVMDEVSFALESGKKIIPVLLEDCLAPFRLRRLQRIDFTSDYTTGFNQLIVSLGLNPGGEGKASGIPVENIQVDASSPVSASKEAHDKEKRDNTLWEEACRVNTIASYRKYLNESAGGLFEDEAKLMIKQLEVEQKEEELEALLWKKAKTEHSKILYQHYLQEHPQGNYKTLALAAIAEFEKAEKQEELRLKEIAAQQERERVQKAAAEKEKADQLEKERLQKAKEEKEKADQLERERLQKVKEEKEKADQLEKERLQKAKEEKEKQLQLEREKAQQAKIEKEKALAIEREKAQREKEEKEKQLRLEKEKAQREKEEREKQKQEEKEKAALAKKLEKEKAEKERIANGGAPAPSGGSKKYIFIGGGLLAICAVIFFMTRGGGDVKDDRVAWKEALQKNDSTAFANYIAQYPAGKYIDLAKVRIDSLYWVHKDIRDSLAALSSSTVATPEPPKTNTITTPPVEAKPDPAPKTNTETNPKTNTPVKPKQTSPEKPKQNTSPNTAGKISLGQEYGGGIVIYVNPKGDHGMIVSSKEVGSVDWEKAQKICAAYKVGSFGSWRLPSKDELNIIYQNRKFLGTYNKGNYWSASEEGKNSATVINFANGNQGKSNKQSANAVRAVRPF